MGEDRRGKRESIFHFPFSIIQLFLFTILGFLLFFHSNLSSFAQEVVNPNSYRHDYRRMPEWEEINEFANLLYPLNIEIRQIASKDPSVVTDKQGNKTIYFDGKPVLQIDRKGDLTFFLKGQKARTTTADGRLIRTYQWNNKGRCTVKNEWGETLGDEEYGLGGKLLKRFDSHGNLAQIYEYDDRSTGYWEYNLATKVWKRYDLGSPVEERRGTKDGSLLAYWKEENGCLWRIEKTSIVVDDLSDDGSFKQEEIEWQVVDGDRTKFDEFGIEMQATYDRAGNLKVSYEWENHRLVKVVDHINGTYEKHGEFGIIEQGVLEEGKEIASWVHEWKGSRRLYAYELMVDPVTRSPVQSGRYISYSAEDKVDETGLLVNETNIDWLNELYEDEAFSFKVGDKLVQEDYVYFYEVRNLNVKQLQAFFHTTGDIAGYIYNIIQDFKMKDKADTGLFAKVTYGLVDDPSLTDNTRAVRLTFFNEYSFEQFTMNAVDPVYNATFEAKFLFQQAQNYWEWGNCSSVLKVCDEFEDSYLDDLGDFNNGLGREYFKILCIKVQALEKMGEGTQVEELTSFIKDNFGSLVGEWGNEYVPMMDSLVNS